MPRTEFETVVCEQTYLDVEETIRDTCSRFVWANGGDLDEAFSIANETFVKIYNRDDYDPDKSTYRSWIRRKVWYALLEEMRTRVGKNNRLPRVYIDFESCAVPEEFEFTETGFYKRLSRDARFVVNLIVKDHIPLIMEIYSRDGLYTPGNVRNSLKRVLFERGWSVARVYQSFDEIQKAMSPKER